MYDYFKSEKCTLSNIFLDGVTIFGKQGGHNIRNNAFV